VHTPTTPNTAPTITSIANQTVDKDGTSQALSFTIGDKESPVELLNVTGTSDNQALVRSGDANDIFISPNPVAARTVLIKPVVGQVGTATITITVTDGGTPGGAPLNASTSFTVTVLTTKRRPSQRCRAKLLNAIKQPHRQRLR
jgi:hypothetical protein